jgi:hypothetical protein
MEPIGGYRSGGARRIARAPGDVQCHFVDIGREDLHARRQAVFFALLAQQDCD